MSLRYERQISIEFPINSQDKLREFVIEMQKQDFFLGEYKHCTTKDYYVPYTEVRHNSAFVFTDANNQEMFSSEYEYESMRISNQLTANGYIHEMVEKVEEVDIVKENEIPSLSSLYLTDNEKVTTSTIEGEDMNLDIYLTNYSWRNELTIVYTVQWTTDSKRAPKEIESRMNDYFISEIAHIQQVLVDSLMNHAIIVNEPVLDCKFECINHTSQACSQDIADATLFRITEAME
jgi:hypothetical protein